MMGPFVGVKRELRFSFSRIIAECLGIRFISWELLTVRVLWQM